MELKEIKKLNLQDGDILFFPKEYVALDELYNIMKAINTEFPDKKVLMVHLEEGGIQGLKVVNIKEESENDVKTVGEIRAEAERKKKCCSCANRCNKIVMFSECLVSEYPIMDCISKVYRLWESNEK